MDIKKLRSQYANQRSAAKSRGIDWKLTFEEWLNWWGEDIHKRGRGHNLLQMQRHLDQGAYELGNIKKGVPKENSGTWAAMHHKRKVDKAKKEHQDFLNSLIWEPSAPDKEEIETYKNQFELEMQDNGHAKFTYFYKDN